MAQQVEGQQPASKGIIVTEGAELSIHGLKIAMGPEGFEVTDEGTTLRQDLCRHWLRIALGHLEDSAVAHRNLIDADSSGNEDELGTGLETEFRASMQAIAASGFALDSLYGAVKERIEISPDLSARWKTNRTARWKQMAEVFRRAFRLKADAARALGAGLEEVSKYRDWAVHPPADQKRPVFREDIARGVEWRFVAFRHANARTIVLFTLGNIRALTKNADLEPESLNKYCEALSTAVEPLWTQLSEDGGE